MKAPGKLGAFFMTPQVYVSIAASLIAAIIAIWGVITQRVIARRRATIDYITRQQSDGDFDPGKAEIYRAFEGRRRSCALGSGS